jgi:hypothetical protein
VVLTGYFYIFFFNMYSSVKQDEMSSKNVPQFRSYNHDLTLVKDERVLAVHSYWLSIHNGDNLPSRTQLDPLQFPNGLLGYISLLDVIPDGKGGYRFLFRLAGTISYAHGVMIKRISGNELHDVLPPGEAEPVVRDWTQAILTRRPIAATGISFPFKCGPRPWEAIALPLSSDGLTVDVLLTARVPLRRP